MSLAMLVFEILTADIAVDSLLVMVSLCVIIQQNCRCLLNVDFLNDRDGWHGRLGLGRSIDNLVLWFIGLIHEAIRHHLPFKRPSIILMLQYGYLLARLSR